MHKFKKEIKNYIDFRKKVVDPCSKALSNPEWLKDEKKFYSMEGLYFFISNQFNNRYTYHKGEEFLGYFNNIFVNVTPKFYAKVVSLINDELALLKDNNLAGNNSRLESESKRADSTVPYNGVVNGKDLKADKKEQNDYNMTTRTENPLEIARRRANAKISGEVKLYTASFEELFTTMDMKEVVNKSFTPEILDIMYELAEAVEKLGGVELNELTKHMDEIKAHTQAMEHVVLDNRDKSQQALNIANGAEHVSSVNTPIVKSNQKKVEHVSKVLEGTEAPSAGNPFANKTLDNLGLLKPANKNKVLTVNAKGDGVVAKAVHKAGLPENRMFDANSTKNSKHLYYNGYNMNIKGDMISVDGHSVGKYYETHFTPNNLSFQVTDKGVSQTVIFGINSINLWNNIEIKPDDSHNNEVWIFQNNKPIRKLI